MLGVPATSAGASFFAWLLLERRNSQEETKMAIGKKSAAAQSLLNTVARKLGTAAGTVTRVTKEISVDLLRSSTAASARSSKGSAAAKKAAKVRGPRAGVAGQTPRTRTTTTKSSGRKISRRKIPRRKISRRKISRRKIEPGPSKPRQHRKSSQNSSSRTAKRVRNAGSSRNALR